MATGRGAARYGLAALGTGADALDGLALMPGEALPDGIR